MPVLADEEKTSSGCGSSGFVSTAVARSIACGVPRLQCTEGWLPGEGSKALPIAPDGAPNPSGVPQAGGDESAAGPPDEPAGEERVLDAAAPPDVDPPR